jgi:hypothetical protein
VPRAGTHFSAYGVNQELLKILKRRIFRVLKKGQVTACPTTFNHGPISFRGCCMRTFLQKLGI